MNLDAVTIAIRPRRPWEAVDLGVLMARRWWWLLTKVWVTISFPIWLMLCFIPQEYIYWQIIIFWFLKPIMERPLLHVLSHAVFDQAPSYGSAVKAGSTLIFRKLFSTLLWRRLSPSRSMNLPVDQLEGLSGGRRSDRLTVLDREDSSPAGWLSLLGFFFEIILCSSLVSMLYAFIPHAVEVDLYGLLVEREYTWFNLMVNSLHFITVMLVAPFYVAMGFALYLNRRIKLEAWDVEIAFRRIAQREAKEKARRAQLGGGTAAVLFACLLSVSSLFHSPHTQAADTASLPGDVVEVTDREEAKALVDEVFSTEPFHQIVTEKTVDYDQMDGGWFTRFIQWVSDLFNRDDEIEEHEFDGGSDLGFLASLLANGTEILLWMLVIGLVCFVVYRYRHWLASFNLPEMEKAEKKDTPETLFGMDVRPQSLPLDVSEQALKMWQEGQYRNALALLYRASLVDLFKRGLDVDEGATEQECLKASLANQAKLNIPDGPMQYFSTLTHHWRRLAYGHIPPSDEQGVGLCKDWLTVWRAEPAAAGVVKREGKDD